MADIGSTNVCIECGYPCEVESIVCEDCVHLFYSGLACLYCRQNASTSAVCEPCRQDARESGDEDLFGARHIQMMVRNQANLPRCIYCHKTLGIRGYYCIHCDRFQEVEAPPSKPKRSTFQKIGRWYLIYSGFSLGLALIFLALSGLIGLTTNGEDRSPNIVTPRPQPTYPLNQPSTPIPNQNYNVICKDGWLSTSGGSQGACSHHGGLP